MAVKSATVGRDRPRSTCDRKPTERSIFCASCARVSFLCLRRSWISAARVASSCCWFMKFMSRNFMKNYRINFMGARLMELEAHLFSLEQALQQSSIRSDAAQLERLLADDFVEFGASGNIWGSKAQVIAGLQDEAFSARRM